MVKILIAEDDTDLCNALSKFLKNNNFNIVSCYDGEEALEKFEETSPDLILTDIMMPKMDGFQLAKEIREFNKNIPIIFMTAKTDKVSKMQGYSIGIDDYIEKPFDLDILLYRLEAILRRANISREKVIEIGNFRINEEERAAYVNDEPISLSVREFNILFHLVSNPKKTFTRSSLMESFWDYDSSATSRTVDVYMAKLREKTLDCDGFKIETVHGLGYKVVLNNEKK